MTVDQIVFLRAVPETTNRQTRADRQHRFTSQQLTLAQAYTLQYSLS